MKKLLVILVVLIGISINANAIVWRGTHKVCNSEAELTLKSEGAKMIFWYGGQARYGTYNVEDGYLHLYENGNRIYSFKYSYNQNTNTLYWVDMDGTKLYKDHCK